MLKGYPKFKRGYVWEFYEKLPKPEQKFFDEYLVYRKARGISTESDLTDIKRYLAHLRYILQKDLRKINLKELREIIALLNTSRLTDYVKDDIKSDLKNFLKYAFPDWSIKFSDLADIRLSNTSNEEKINSKTIYAKEDIENMMKHENKTFWKAFLILQYEAGLRTGECRNLKWDDLKLNSDGDISEINIYATKTKRARPVFVKEATFYLKKLKEEQENNKEKSIFIFPSKSHPNQCIDKSTISTWFRALSKKALGRIGWNYLLRHSRATELYRMAHNNEISEDTAIKFMGHSKDMSRRYTHIDDVDIKNMLKNQVYKIEDLPPATKHKLEIAMEKITKDNEKLKEDNKEIKGSNKILYGLYEKLMKEMGRDEWWAKQQKSKTMKKSLHVEIDKEK
jgi:integrase